MDRKRPQVIVAISRNEFQMTCSINRWNPFNIKYVHVSDVDEGLRGFSKEDIYPAWYGEFSPSKKETD